MAAHAACLQERINYMPRIPFIEARLGLAEESPKAIERRLTDYLTSLRAKRRSGKAGGPSPEGHDAADQSSLIPDPGFDDRKYPSKEDLYRIQSRSNKLFERRRAASGLQHLNRQELDRLSVLRDGVRLVPVETEHRADELAAELHVAMPWMAAATEEVWMALRRSAAAGEPGARIPPLLLDGPPGIGKTVWARRLGELLGVPSDAIDASGEPASFSVTGLQKGWSGAAPGRPVELILRTLVGNPIVVVDEIEKTGQVHSNRGQSHSMTEGLLPLLEPASARRWSCPAFRVVFDMSWVSWILLSNSIAPLPEPLLSRVRIVRLEPPSLDHLIQFAWEEGRRRDLQTVSIEAVEEGIRRLVFDKGEISLRTVIRLLERAKFLERRPPLN